eukprot:m.40651 g.40651  ORF g.40651 m.40651 type:complete len:560 (+) comp9691_c0_seq1:267-1946(+)
MMGDKLVQVGFILSTALLMPTEARDVLSISQDSVPTNKYLTGVNNEWVSPMEFVTMNHKEGKWQPSTWVNATSPLLSKVLIDTMKNLSLGIHRYPGGSIGNWWDWRKGHFSEDALNCTDHNECKVYEMYQNIMNNSFEEAFPFNFTQFNAMTEAVGAGNLFTLDISTTTDISVPSMVVQALGLKRASRFEVGNEVYDPRQGPPLKGFATVAEYYQLTKPVFQAIRNAGAKSAVPLSPCPLFYPANSSCWGGINGRYHQWNHNVSLLCSISSEDKAVSCPFDALVGHNYVADVKSFAPYPNESHWLPLFLTMPFLSISNSVNNIQRIYPDGNVKMWMSEYNAFYPDVWNGAADSAHYNLSAFFNSTENSGAHALFVASHIMAGMVYGDTIEVMNYHSFLETNTMSQPGFAVTSINSTGVYISPVAQILRKFSVLLKQNGTMHGVTIEDASVQPFTMDGTLLGNSSEPCLQATAICGGVNTFIILNRCARAVETTVNGGCNNQTLVKGFSMQAEVYHSSLAPAGEMWANILSGNPLTPETKTFSNTQITIDPVSLYFISMN